MKANWNIVNLGDFCEVVTKGTTPTSIGHKFVEQGINFIKVESIKENGSFLINKFSFIDEQGHEGLKRSQLKEGDILFSIAGALGRTAIVSKDILPANTNQALSIIRLKKDAPLKKKFLISALNSGYILDQIEENKGGVAQQNLSLTQVRNFQIPIPPLQEQKQIVAILDEAFAAIDQAKANLEKNIQNAKELFQSKLNEIFSQKGEGWEEKKLSDLGKTQTGTTPPTNDRSNYGDFIPFVKPAHFMPDGSIESGDCMLSESGLKKGRLFEANSVLMVCIGATIGKTGYTETAVSSNQQINALTPNENYEPKLLYYALISPFVQKQVLIEGKGAQATLPIINKSKWEKIRVFVPSEKSVQTRIINLLDEMNISTKNIEVTYRTKLSHLADLKKSILQKAFAGELKLEKVEIA